MKPDIRRVLIVHNQYQHRGGEDSVVEAEAAMLSAHGVQVDLLLVHNDAISNINKVNLAARTVWSVQGARRFEAKLNDARPDVVHVHNTFPLISPSIYWSASRAGIPVVQTLHNFRLMCPQAMFLREGKVCEDCLGKVPWRGAVRGCYRDSRAQSLVLAGMLTVHRAMGTWSNKVTRFIALNEFCRAKFVEGGLPADRMVVKPNFVDYPSIPEHNQRDGLLYVGRLSSEKGINVLAEAMEQFKGMKLRIAGTGPEQARLEGLDNVSLLGALSGDGVREAMLSARALVLPSIWYENFPRTIVEAFATGLPVIASRIGALGELVKHRETGLLFDPGCPNSLVRQLEWAATHPNELASMGEAARHHYEQNFTAERNLEQLLTIYSDAISDVAIPHA